MVDKPPSAKGSDTSAAAADSVESIASSLRAQILALISQRPGGLTTDEVEVLMSLRHQTASARVWELHKRSLIGDSGKRRKTRSGRLAVVYQAINREDLAEETRQMAVEARRTTEEVIAAAVAETLEQMVGKLRGGSQ